jgi:hypothetical protein
MRLEAELRGVALNCLRPMAATRQWTRPLLGLVVVMGVWAWQADAQLVYFLVGPLYPGIETDSYVLPVSRPEGIAHARDLIIRGWLVNGEPNQPIAIARIAAGKDGINRDFLAPDRHEWSWHVVEFLGFSDLTVPEWSGSPTDVERDVSGFIQNSEGRIGFAFYTVTAELGPELAVLAQPVQGGLKFSWPDLSTNAVYTVNGTNFVYTLEYKAALTSTNWLAVDGVAWPIKDQAITLPAPAVTSRFYRLRAEFSPP